MPTYTDATQALNALKSHLQTRLDDDYVATFSSYGGADVVTEDAEYNAAMQVGKPCIVLALSRDEDVRETWGDGARAATVRSEVMASEFAGALIGTANPVSSDELLSRALAEIIDADFLDLTDLGLLDSRQRTTSQQVRDDDGQVVHVNGHEITFVYLTE